LGDPILVDESIERFDPDIKSVREIIVGIGISSGNCYAGYRVESKLKGHVIMGVYATIFPRSHSEWSRCRWSPAVAK